MPTSLLVNSQSNRELPALLLEQRLSYQENRDHVLSNSNENSCSEIEKLLRWLSWTYRDSAEEKVRAPYHRRTRVCVLTNQFLYDSWVH